MHFWVFHLNTVSRGNTPHDLEKTGKFASNPPPLWCMWSSFDVFPQSVADFCYRWRENVVSVTSDVIDIKGAASNKANPWSWCCEGNSLSKKGIFMILMPQYFPVWIRRYVWVYFSKENTLEAGLEGNSLVKSNIYLIVIFFQGGIFRRNRPVFNIMTPYRLDTLQLTEGKEKSSAAQCSTGWFKKNSAVYLKATRGVHNSFQYTF